MKTSPRKALIIGSGIAGPALALFLQKAGIESEIYEARPGPEDEAGAFLNLAPNGMNVLKSLGIGQPVETGGFPVKGMMFFNGEGRRLGVVENEGEADRFGSRSVVIKRGQLQKVLREEVLRRNIPVHYGKKLTDIRPTGFQGVTAHFADGTTAEGDMLIGCDGIHSRTRRLTFPAAPEPSYTGLVDCGGFVRCHPALWSSGYMHMTFGKKAFFGYLAKPDGEVYWFSNVAVSDEPAEEERRAVPDGPWKDLLLERHGEDPEPIPAILRAMSSGIGRWPIYDLPSLPRWHKGPVCLIGDAAHATSPHAGQGASLALEDAAVLARCLREVPDFEGAFALFQSRRRERVEKLVQQARRIGSRKAVTHPIALWFRDLILPFFLKRSAKSAAWVYAYKADAM
ncbi:FAD-dependent oxidoreductase [Larkinella soli]|uniref:FAD-dependent oxidoreductase n=1 Tax=Larkinella soli TaxID=1770527 RepID=UPI000FFB6DDE|nr:NAD(P)/FAD-dependent oxidoreductase [Larkinella soli]